MADRALAGEVPRIRRARGYRLYDVAGRRLLDLWQAGGEAILGHRPAHAGPAVKAALDRGLAAPLPTAWQSRLLSALAARFPSYRSFRLFTSRERALAAVSRVLGAAVAASDVADPGLGTRGSGQVGLWRPFLPGEPDWPVLLPVLPFALGGSPAAACFRTTLPDDVEPSDAVAGFAVVAALRGLRRPRRGEARRPRAAAVPRWVSGMGAQGPYLGPAFAAEAYPQVFRAFLSRGVLLSPVYPGPSILPGEASEGERRLVASLFHSLPRG